MILDHLDPVWPISQPKAGGARVHAKRRRKLARLSRQRNRLV